MGTFPSLLRRLRAWRGRDRLDDQLADEIRLHLELRAQALTDAGMDPAEAAREAKRMFGNSAAIREETRDMWGFPSIDTVMQDLRYGLRMLRRSPTFTAVTVMSLAIGIGATAAVFSLADAMLLRTLPVQAPGDLVVVRWNGGPVFPFASLNGYASQIDDGLSSTSFSAAAYGRMRAESAGLADVFGFADLYRVSLSVDGQAEMGLAHAVSGNYFQVLGVTPALGRPLLDSDDRAGATPAAVISHSLWLRQFGGSPGAIGKPMIFNGASVEVVGVMPAVFRGTGQVTGSPDVYVPLALRSQLAPLGEAADDPDVWWVLMMARLKPGVRAEQLQPALDLILKQTIASVRPAMESKDLPRVEVINGSRGQVEERDHMREPLRTMGIVVGIVLLVACANVANLLLARGSARVRELTVRVAVGAPRRRVVRQLLTEGLLLALCGSALGLLAAHWIAQALWPALQGASSEAVASPGLSLRVVGFAALVASLCAVLFSLVPALRATDIAVAAGLQDAGRSAAAGRTRGGLSSALVVTQIALSMVLIATAVLLVRSVQRLQRVDLGFDSANVLLFRVDPTLNGYKDAHVIDLYGRMLERLRATPGVRAATVSSHTLISNSSSMGIALRTNETAPDPAGPDASAFRRTHAALRLTVDAGFFSTLGLPLVRGRIFDDGDNAVSQKVAVVNRAMARQLFGSEDVIGRQFRLAMAPESPVYEIVGVSADARYASLRRPMAATVYLSYRQQQPGAMTFEVKTDGDPAAFAPVARNVVRSIDSALPLTAVQSQQDQIEVSLQPERLFATLATWLGSVTVGLSAIGLYALLAYGVTRRTPEIGIRMALGAERADVRWMIVRQSLVLAAWGLAIGTAAAVAGTRLVEALLFEVQARDPLAIGAAAALMLAVSLAAAYLPARRAARVSPLVALRGL